MFRSFIKVTALSLILISTFFLIKGVLGLSVKDILELSTIPYRGYNYKLVQNFTQQKSDTIVGFVLMLLAFILSLIDLLMPMYCDEFAMNRKGLIAAIVVSIIIFFVAYATSCFLQNKWYKEVQDFIGVVYRFPNMLAENKNPTAYGADGEYSRQISIIKHRESIIEYPTLAHS